MGSLDTSIEALVHSYHTYGLVNHADGANIPSRASIEAILQGLGELLFPGFREHRPLHHDDLRLSTAETVYRLARELTAEVEKSLAFALRSRRPAKNRRPELSCGNDGCHAAAELIVGDFFADLPRIRVALAEDLAAMFRGDPAAQSVEEVIVSYPGFEAIRAYRLAHFFWDRGVPFIPRMMSETVHRRTGIDIHPGAVIGDSFCIDHGTGIVIGGTSVIGNNVKIYQGVTLGALSVKKSEAGHKRHPTIEDDVTIYSGATILGGDTVVGAGCVIGGNVWITASVPPGTVVSLGGAGRPAP